MLAELLLGQPIFPGDSGVDQLVEIIKVLGTPTREQIREMNPNYTEFKFPQIKAHPWQKVKKKPSSSFIRWRSLCHFIACKVVPFFLLEILFPTLKIKQSRSVCSKCLRNVGWGRERKVFKQQREDLKMATADAVDVLAIMNEYAAVK